MMDLKLLLKAAPALKKHLFATYVSHFGHSAYARLHSLNM